MIGVLMDMKREEFYFHADKFRDPKVWFKKDGYWSKIDIDGIIRAYHRINE